MLSILLLFLYLIPSIGVNASFHYCGEDFAGIAVAGIHEHPCSCDPDIPMDADCCSDEDFSIKIKDNHKNVDSKILVKDVSKFAFALTFYSDYGTDYLNDSKIRNYRIEEKEPPDDRLFVLFESYLI